MTREEAIEMLVNATYSDEWQGDEKLTDAHLMAIEALKAGPKHGKWEMKPDPYGFFDEIPVCSGCGCTTNMREVYNYCPNCGAKMQGEE